MGLEYEVKQWVKGEEDEIPLIMENFSKVVNIDYNGKLMIQKLSSIGSVQIVPKDGLITTLSIYKGAGLSSEFLGESTFGRHGFPIRARSCRLIIEGTQYHVVSSNVLDK